MKYRNQEISASLEDYLETILDLEARNKVARVKDIADQLGILRGSVTGALKALAEKGLVNYAPYNYITLTPQGKTIARDIARKHAVIKDFLKNVLLLDPDASEANACRMEHAMDKDAINRLVQFIEYIHTCPRAGQDWVAGFVDYYSNISPDRKLCKKCLENCVERFESQAQ